MRKAVGTIVMRVTPCTWSARHMSSGRILTSSRERTSTGTPLPSGARISARESTKVSAVLHAQSSPTPFINLLGPCSSYGNAFHPQCKRASSPLAVPSTPFGSPVEPLVNKMYATSGGMGPSVAASREKLSVSQRATAGFVRESRWRTRLSGVDSSGIYTPPARQMARIAAIDSAERLAMSAMSGCTG
eukprot:scaffold170820_cov31-Tisochrysis_lutea.AAC.1